MQACTRLGWSFRTVIAVNVVCFLDGARLRPRPPDRPKVSRRSHCRLSLRESASELGAGLQTPPSARPKVSRRSHCRLSLRESASELGAGLQTPPSARPKVSRRSHCRLSLRESASELGAGLMTPPSRPTEGLPTPAPSIKQCHSSKTFSHAAVDNRAPPAFSSVGGRQEPATPLRTKRSSKSEPAEDRVEYHAPETLDDRLGQIGRPLQRFG